MGENETNPTSNLKYTDEEYLNCGFYSPDDDDIRNYQSKIVTVRKDHPCMGGCDTIILKNSKSMLETGFFEEQPSSVYTCIPCLDAWIEESGMYESKGEQIG